MGRKAGLVVTMSALAGLWACGGGGGSTGPTLVATPAPTPSPTPPVVLLQVPFTVRDGFSVLYGALPVSGPGVLEVTVDWTAAANDLDIVLARGTCTVAMYQADTCEFVAFADSATTKPERLRVNVTTGMYTPIIESYGPGDESGTILVVFNGGISVTAAASQPMRTTRVKKPRLHRTQQPAG
jgi:hypothetical protein